jgi:hypothetical protein
MPRPPIGISILGFFALMSGASQAFAGFILMGAVAFGPVPTGDGVFLAGLFAVLTGAIYIAVGLSAWTLQPWAYGFGLYMSAFGIMNGVFVLIATGSLSYGLAVLAFPIVVFWYLQRPEVQRAFVEAATARGQIPPVANTASASAAD